MTSLKHSCTAWPLSRHDPSQSSDTLQTTTSVLTTPDFIQERAFPPPPGLYPHRATSLPRHEYAGAVCSLPPIWEALGLHPRETLTFRNTPYTPGYFPPMQHGAPFNRAPLSTSYEYVSANSTPDLQVKDPGASFPPTAIPAIAQVPGQGLHVSALLNKTSNTIPEGRERMVTFKSHHNAQHPLPCTAQTTSEPNDKLVEEYNTEKSCTDIAKPFSDRSGGSCSYRFRHGWTKADYEEVKSRRERGSSKIAHHNAVMARKPWTPEEDEIIRTGRKNGETPKEIHSRLSHRTLPACKARILIICSRTRPPSQIWSRDDVAKLEALVRRYGKGWEEISRQFEGRTPGACRMRYHEIQKG